LSSCNSCSIGGLKGNRVLQPPPHLAPLHTDVAELELVVVLDEALHGLEARELWGRAARYGTLFVDQRVRVATQGTARRAVKGDALLRDGCVPSNACASSRWASAESEGVQGHSACRATAHAGPQGEQPWTKKKGRKGADSCHMQTCMGGQGCLERSSRGGTADRIGQKHHAPSPPSTEHPCVSRPQGLQALEHLACMRFLIASGKAWRTPRTLT